MDKLWSVLKPPSRGAGQKLPAGGCEGFAALVAPAAGIAVEHRPIVATLGLTAGSETHAAHVEDLMIPGHNIPPWPNSMIALSPIFRRWHCNSKYDTTSWRRGQGKKAAIWPRITTTIDRQNDGARLLDIVVSFLGLG